MDVDIAAMIAEFHATFGQSFGDGGSDNACRIRLHREEYRELVEALYSGDRVAIAHELADVVYVAYGTGFSRGLDIDALIDHPQLFHERPLLIIQRQLIAALDNDRESIGLSLAELVATCYFFAYWHLIDLDAVIATVHRANMSKAGPDGRMALDEHGKVVKPEGFRPPNIAALLAGGVKSDG